MSTDDFEKYRDFVERLVDVDKTFKQSLDVIRNKPGLNIPSSAYITNLEVSFTKTLLSLLKTIHLVGDNAIRSNLAEDLWHVVANATFIGEVYGISKNKLPSYGPEFNVIKAQPAYEARRTQREIFRGVLIKHLEHEVGKRRSTAAAIAKRIWKNVALDVENQCKAEEIKPPKVTERSVSDLILELRRPNAETTPMTTA